MIGVAQLGERSEIANRGDVSSPRISRISSAEDIPPLEEDITLQTHRLSTDVVNRASDSDVSDTPRTQLKPRLKRRKTRGTVVRHYPTCQNQPVFNSLFF